MVNGTLLNFVKRYNNNNLRVIFDQWLKLHLGLDALSNQKLLKGIYFIRNPRIRNECNFLLLQNIISTQCDLVEKKRFSYHNQPYRML